jgi:DNA-binding transcriptional LysR family regulator
LDFFVSDTRDVPLGPDLEVTPLPRQHGGFYVRAGHPLLAKAKVRPQDMVPYGLATVRLPLAVQDATRGLLGLPPQAPLPFALECEDVGTLKSVALATDTVLACTRAAVHAEVSAGCFAPLTMAGLPPLYAETGLVALRGRSHSPMAEYVIGRLTALAEEMATLGTESTQSS